VAYVFERSGDSWRLVQTVPPPANMTFIRDVSLSDDRLLLLAEEHRNGPQTQRQALWVMRREEGRWVDDGDLTPPRGRSYLWDVSLAEDVAAATYHQAATGEVDLRIGVVVFERSTSGWRHLASLDDPSGVSSPHGFVAASDNIVALGLPIETYGWGTSYGRVHIFQRGPASDCICGEARRAVPAAEIDAALLHPERYPGWQQPRSPGLAPGPGNPWRDCLGLRNPGARYHPVWNPLAWRVGCG
jgi:hypothetical protein